MRECTQLSETGLYMRWEYWVHVNSSGIYILCQNLLQVKSAWRYLRKEYKGKNLSVHRFPVVDDIDNQMRRKNISRFTSLLKTVIPEHKTAQQHTK